MDLCLRFVTLIYWLFVTFNWHFFCDCLIGMDLCLIRIARNPQFAWSLMIPTNWAHCWLECCLQSCHNHSHLEVILALGLWTICVTWQNIAWILVQSSWSDDNSRHVAKHEKYIVAFFKDFKVEVWWTRPAKTCTYGIQAGAGFILVQMPYSEDCHHPFFGCNRADGKTLGIKRKRQVYVYFYIYRLYMKPASCSWVVLIKESIMQKERNQTMSASRPEGPKAYYA